MKPIEIKHRGTTWTIAPSEAGGVEICLMAEMLELGSVRVPLAVFPKLIEALEAVRKEVAGE